MRKLAAALGVLALLATVGSASAASITYNLSTVFSGGTPQNLLTASFDDGGVSGSVTLTMSMSGPSLTEFVSNWYFNFSGNSLNLNFNPPPVITGSVEEPAITHTPDCCQAGPDGKFDIRFAFATSAQAGRMGTGEQVVYTITGIGITASDFDVLSAPGGGAGTFFTAAHVQAICADPPDCNQDDSAWVTIPEPGAALLFGLGSLLAGAAIRRRA